MHKRRAFTFIEILVVIGIIVILTALLIPMVAGVRAGAARTRCAAQLRDIGQMLQMYFGENHNTLPKVNMMPSLRPPLNSYPSLVQLLAPRRPGGAEVFHCPADKITQPAPAAPPGFDTYFAREQSSYYWNEEISVRASHITELKMTENVLLLQEYEPFHGPAGESGSMNRLYADLHVDGSARSIMVIGG